MPEQLAFWSRAGERVPGYFELELRHGCLNLQLPATLLKRWESLVVTVDALVLTLRQAGATDAV